MSASAGSTRELDRALDTAVARLSALHGAETFVHNPSSADGPIVSIVPGPLSSDTDAEAADPAYPGTATDAARAQYPAVAVHERTRATLARLDGLSLRRVLVANGEPLVRELGPARAADPISVESMRHIPIDDRGQVFAEACRVLRPGGRMIVGVKNSLFEHFFKGDRFAAVDITDVAAKQLRFTDTRSGEEFTAAWCSFSPHELKALFAAAGMIVTHLRGNSALSAWLADEVLRDSGVANAVHSLERGLGDVPPFNHLGHHLLVEAVKPRR